MTDLLSTLADLDDQDREQFLLTLKDHERTLLLGLLPDSVGLDIPLEDHQRIDGEEAARIVMFMAGRGAGKTYKGAAWAAMKAEVESPGLAGALIAPTFQAVREVMVEGAGSGIIAQLGDRIVNYNRSTFEITTRSGSRIYMRSADRPDSIRGLNLNWAWCDEIGAWTRPEAWHEGLMPALRIGDRPQVMVTTTPRRVRLVRELYKRYTECDDTIVLGTATTFDNPHLSDLAKEELLRLYGGTQIGEQELYGKLIDVVVGAIWRPEWIQRCTRQDVIGRGGMAQVVVGVDPSGSIEGTGDECGIVVCGRGNDGTGYVIADDTIRGTPGEWVNQIIQTFHHSYGVDSANEVAWRPSYVAIEGDGSIGVMAKELIARLDQHIPVNVVYTKGKSKEDRARPISMMWEQGRVFHIGLHEHLEGQLVEWVPGEVRGFSPDRIDAMVWGFLSLFPAYGNAGTSIPTTDRRLSLRGR